MAINLLMQWYIFLHNFYTNLIVDFTRETYIGICKKEKEKIEEKIMKLKRIAVAVLSLALTAGAVGTVLFEN